mmetsp:Transcript_46105/g.147505  ORF Transcript_46105/g.147505 Transcript_46105/m.147505 type:complete len:401 (+) Transcript_46105:566-1768(+)
MCQQEVDGPLGQPGRKLPRRHLCGPGLDHLLNVSSVNPPPDHCKGLALHEELVLHNTILHPRPAAAGSVDVPDVARRPCLVGEAREVRCVGRRDLGGPRAQGGIRPLAELPGPVAPGDVAQDAPEERGGPRPELIRVLGGDRGHEEELRAALDWTRQERGPRAGGLGDHAAEVLGRPAATRPQDEGCYGLQVDTLRRPERDVPVVVLHRPERERAARREVREAALHELAFHALPALLHGARARPHRHLEGPLFWPSLDPNAPAPQDLGRLERYVPGQRCCSCALPRRRPDSPAPAENHLGLLRRSDKLGGGGGGGGCHHRVFPRRLQQELLQGRGLLCPRRRARGQEGGGGGRPRGGSGGKGRGPRGGARQARRGARGQEGRLRPAHGGAAARPCRRRNQ